MAIIVKPVHHRNLICSCRILVITVATNHLSRKQELSPLLVIVNLLLGQSGASTVGDKDFDWLSSLVHVVDRKGDWYNIWTNGEDGFRVSEGESNKG